MTNTSAIKILAVMLEFVVTLLLCPNESLTNYFGKFLDFFDHLPPFVYTWESKFENATAFFKKFYYTL